MPKNTILKDVDGRYFYRFTDESGMRRALRSRKGETRRAFAERCDAAERSEDSSTWTFAQLWDAWSLVRKNTVSAHTYNEQQRMYQRLLEKPFGSLLIQDITRQAVYRFLQRLGAEGASHAYLSKIKGCLSLPYKWGRMALQLKASDPTEGISLKGLSKKRETRVRVISADEEQRFFEAAAGSVWYNFFRLLLTTGMRPSEAMGLQLVDLAEEGIHITRGYTRNGLSTLKTKNAARVFPWTAQLREIVANQKEQLRDLGISSGSSPQSQGNPPSMRLPWRQNTTPVRPQSGSAEAGTDRRRSSALKTRSSSRFTTSGIPSLPGPLVSSRHGHFST